MEETGNVRIGIWRGSDCRMWVSRVYFMGDAMNIIGYRYAGVDHCIRCACEKHARLRFDQTAPIAGVLPVMDVYIYDSDLIPRTADIECDDCLELLTIDRQADFQTLLSTDKAQVPTVDSKLKAFILGMNEFGRTGTARYKPRTLHDPVYPAFLAYMSGQRLVRGLLRVLTLGYYGGRP